MIPFYETPEEKELLDQIDRWHNEGGNGIQLWEYLGWTEEQYDKWVVTGQTPDGFYA